MSLWTYATVKFWVNGEMSIGEIQRLVGYQTDYHDITTLKLYDNDKLNPWETSNIFLSIGSEGTLKIYVHKTTVKETVFTVTGGLRDLWDVELIQNWFDDVTHRVLREGYFCGIRYVKKAKGTAGRDSLGGELKLNYIADINEIKKRLKRS